MACSPEKARRCAEIYSLGQARLRARGLPAGPTMSTTRGASQDQQGPKSAGGWDLPTDPAARAELVRLAETVADRIAGPGDRRRAAPTARAPVTARAALQTDRARADGPMQTAARATWAAYRAQAGGAA